MVDNFNIISNIRNIIGISSSISDEAIIRIINQYLLTDFINDCGAYYLKTIVSFKRVGLSSLYLPSNLHKINLNHIKADINELQYPLEFYTNRRVRTYYKEVYNGFRGIHQTLIFTEEESKFFESSYIRKNIISGDFNFSNPFIYIHDSGIDKAQLNPYYMDIRIYNSNDLKIPVTWFNPTVQDRIYTEEKGSFKITIDYEIQTLTIIQNDVLDKNNYHVEIDSCNNSGYLALLKDNKIYTYSYPSLDNIVIECYVYPVLIADIDKLDPIIVKAKSLVELGVARLLSIVYEVASSYDEINKKYIAEVHRHKNEEISKITFELNRRATPGNNQLIIGNNSFNTIYGTYY